MHQQTMTFLLVFTLLGGCSWLPEAHKIDIQQGNILDDDIREQIKPGLTRQQVKYLLGSPIVVDPFHKNRWDYVYFVTLAGHQPEKPKRLSLFFENNRLVRIDDDYPVGKESGS